MKILAALSLWLLLAGVEPSWFHPDDEDYVKRVRCMYGFNSSTPQKSPPRLDNASVLYYQLTGANDTVHYIWSLVATPTLYMSVTPPTNETCEESVKGIFEWDEFVKNQSPGSADPPGLEGDFAFSLVFNRLIEYKDKKYTAAGSFNSSDLSNNDTYRAVNLSSLVWTYYGGDDEMKLQARNRSYNSSEDDQFSWNIKLYVPTKPGRVSVFPKTKYSENSTVFDFSFKNFNFTLSDNDDTKYGRLVLEMQLVHGSLKNDSNPEQKFSRDDEYTPSVFLVYNQLFGGGNETQQGFLQWKPISYLSKSRKSTQSQQANAQNGRSITLEEASPGLVTAMYSSNAEAGIIQPVYMIFGTDGDDNNPDPQYVTWTGMLGFGVPPEDTISFVVILTICIGLGVPALLIGCGGVFLVIKRRPWKRCFKDSKAGYTKLDINGDEKK